MAEIENPNQMADDDFLRMMGGTMASAITSEEEKRQKLQDELRFKQKMEQSKSDTSSENNVEENPKTPEESFEATMEQNMASSTGNEKKRESKKEDVENELKTAPNPPKMDEKPMKEASKTRGKSETTKKSNNSNKSKSNKDRSVEIVSPETAAEIKSKQNKPKTVITKDVTISEDLDAQVLKSNKEIEESAIDRIVEESDTYITPSEVGKIIDDSYEFDDAESVEKIDVAVVDDDTEKNKQSEDKTKKPTKTRKTVKYYGGDGKETSFKIRTAKISNVLRNIQVDNTDEVVSTSIDSKNAKDRQDIYLKTVLPTLQPSISVVPMIVSGVVISMTAFTWPDIREIILIEDKIDDLNPNSLEYTYDKNKYFIDKRKKELELLYKHINSVSGYPTKPSFDDLFGKIIKFPDFPQLFFAAYSASFLKPYNFNITCGTCGSDNDRSISSKDLCFLLNSNININQLNYYIEKGAVMDNSVSGKAYADFQKEKIVEMANSTYRTKKKLPVSSFIFDLKIPTILEALDTMNEIVEIFRDKDLSYTDIDTGSTVFVDSSFGLNDDLMNIRKYLYINKLIVAQVIDEDREKKTAKVTFVDFTEKQAILNTIYSLSPEDYVTLINDENLNKLIHVSGIRHAINAGKCGEPTCGADLGNIPVEPEMLFFTTARRESV